LGGPQIDRNGSAAVSRVDNPAPTTNIDPQKPPKDFFKPDGQNKRQPTTRTESPVTKVIRKPNRRRIHPDIVSGQRKYAPK
jgi:hypothetical protein